MKKELAVISLIGLAALGLYAQLVAGPEIAEAMRTVAGWGGAAGAVVLVVVLAAAALGVVGFVWFRLLGEREALLTKRAYRKAAERDARVYHIVARQDEAVYVRDGDPARVWQPLHLNPVHYQNGQMAGPTVLELGTWQYWHSRGAAPATLPAGAAPAAVQWPRRVDLLTLLPNGQASINNLVLGVTVASDGQQQIVASPLAKLVHIALAGSSGWGKSVAARAIAYQLAAAAEPIELCFIDLEGATFSPFAQVNKLRYPAADTEAAALAILHDLVGELERRKKLFMSFPTVDGLEAYNQAAPEPLPPLTCLIDEASALMDNRDIEAVIRTLALRARKYGVYLLLSGQDFKAATLDSSIRNQLSTRIQLKAQDGQQSRILLGDSVAKDIDTPGRGFAILPGRPMIELQTPYIGLSALIQALGRVTGPALRPPLPPEPEPPAGAELVVSMFDEGRSKADICRALGWTPGGNQYAKIEEILATAGRLRQ